jgi:predicted membrane chloride channel (bestrophin family)
LLNSQARRFLTARSLFNLLVSPRQLARRVKVLPVEVKEFPEAKVVVVDHLAEAVAEVVDVQPEVDVALVVPRVRKVLRFHHLRSFL